MLVAPPCRWQESWDRDDLAYSAEPLVSMGSPIIKNKTIMKLSYIFLIEILYV